MKSKKWIFTLTITGILVILATSCKKKESNENNDDSSVQETGTVTDVDANIYKTVKIGKQWWMAENLKVIHYSNGQIIPNITDSITWTNILHGALCFYENDSLAYASDYGALYNWYAVGSNNLCPLGWHVPSDAEWTTLETYLGGSDVAGGKMKESGTTHWALNSGATNSSGFTALPGGSRVLLFNEPYYFFYYLSYDAIFWSSTAFNAENSKGYVLYYGDNVLTMGLYYSKEGCSVRCIKD